MAKDSIYEKVAGYIRQNELISPHDTIIEGISGGADSVCLFLILEELKKEMDFKTVAVHVHHGIRKKSADKDQKFVEKLCASKNVELKSFRKDIPLICKITKESEEECGRRIRYEVFDDVCSMYENAKIAVAHHMNDQAETVLFRIIRGSGIKGLTGMEAKRDNVIRPLLCLKREEIEQYLEESEQDYRVDETNKKIEYSRNYIRKKIIPKLEAVRNNAVEHINALSGEASDINDFMEKKARELLFEASKEADSKYMTKGLAQKYKADVLAAAEPILLKFAVRALISDACVSMKDVSRSHVDKLAELICGQKSGQISLPRGVTFVRESGIVYVRCEEGFDGDIREVPETKDPGPGVPEDVIQADRTAPVDEGTGTEGSADERKLSGGQEPYGKQKPSGTDKGPADRIVPAYKFCYPVDREGEYPLPDGSLIRCRILNDFEMADIPDETYTKWMDYDKMSDDLCIRTRKTGDYLVITQKGNEANLKNYMINEKIPKSERDDIPLLANGSRIYWVVGHRISEDVKVTQGTKRVIEFVYTRPVEETEEQEMGEEAEGAQNEG